MQIFKKQPNINFMRQRKIAVALSVFLILASITSLATKGLNFGLDFTGGTLLEVGFPQVVDLTALRANLKKAGHSDAVVQYFGSTKDVIVRIPAITTESDKGCDSGKNKSNKNKPSSAPDLMTLGDKVLKVIVANEANATMRRQECVGAQVGDELRDDGGLALVIALVCIFIYVIVRFEYRLALGAVAALIHDVTITMGIFSIFQFDFDLTVLAAVLAVIGYSLNDTIVVFDRIRENFRKIRKGTPLDVFNTSLNQTLSRTMMTSVTTLWVLLAMFFLGGELIHSFAIALITGVVIGTYSSIYVAGSAALALGISRENLMPIEKEGAEQENII